MSYNYIPKEFIKDYVDQAPLWNNLHQLKNRITEATAYGYARCVAGNMASYGSLMLCLLGHWCRHIEMT